MNNTDKIILDLCGGTGSWSRPYKEAGYDVRVITLPEYDVLTYNPPDHVYGILAAPPCTDFASSGARWFAEKDRDGRTIDSMGVLIACLRIIADCRPVFWALENPVGRIRRWLGRPVFILIHVTLAIHIQSAPCYGEDSANRKRTRWSRQNEVRCGGVMVVNQTVQKCCALSRHPDLRRRFSKQTDEILNPRQQGEI